AVGPLAHAAASPTDETATPAGDAVSALVHLGYGRLEAVGAVRAASRRLGERATLASLVRAGLKELAA
ncbi:MAG: Holliday junction branch migration protein RuvA, partial [Alphaproteobacteria bacterium]